MLEEEDIDESDDNISASCVIATRLARSNGTSSCLFSAGAFLRSLPCCLFLFLPEWCFCAVDILQVLLSLCAVLCFQ